MKVLYITTVGATMNFFDALVHKLIEDGNRVDIATNECDGGSPVPNCYQEWGCKVYPLSCSRSPLKKGNFAAIREIKEIIQTGGYDIVHCHTPIAAACTRVACRALRNSGVKVFYTAHGFHFYNGAPLKNWLVYYPVEWICAHWTDLLITINREDYELAKKHMHAKHIEYVPGVGIDVKKIEDAAIDRERLRGEFGFTMDDFVLVSVGELSVRKNHEVVIRALKSISDARYLIVGVGQLRDYLQELAEKLGVADRVVFAGFRTDVYELLHMADCFVFPSLQEGLPVALMEAMAAGLPIVASKIRGNVDLIEDGVGGFLCDCRRVDDFTNALRSIMDGQGGNMSGKNRERIKDFDIFTVNQRMSDLYFGVEKQMGE